MCIMSAAMIIMRRLVSMAMIITTVSTTPTYLMELDSIGGVFIFSIKSDMRQIVPDGECNRGKYIGQKKLVEHEEDSEWENRILMVHNIGKYG